MTRQSRLFLTVLLSALLYSCTYNIPYLSLEVRSVYSSPDITINYSYVCENREQRCVYGLYNKLNPSEIIYSGDEVLPQSGKLIFTGLAEGNYRLVFSVYSEKEGEYSLLSFLNESYDFTIDFP